MPEPEFLGAPPVAECGTPAAALLDKPLGCYGNGKSPINDDRWKFNGKIISINGKISSFE